MYNIGRSFAFPNSPSLRRRSRCRGTETVLGQYPTDQFPFALLILTPHQPLKLFFLLSNSDATQADSHFDAFQLDLAHRCWPLIRFDNLNMQIALRSRKFVFRFGFWFVLFVFRFVSVISLRGFASRAPRVTTHATPPKTIS